QESNRPVPRASGAEISLRAGDQRLSLAQGQRFLAIRAKRPPGQAVPGAARRSAAAAWFQWHGPGCGHNAQAFHSLVPARVSTNATLLPFFGKPRTARNPIRWKLHPFHLQTFVNTVNASRKRPCRAIGHAPFGCRKGAFAQLFVILVEKSNRRRLARTVE